MPLEAYPSTREIAASQGAAKATAFSEAMVSSIGGPSWSVRRGTVVLGIITPLWVHLGDWWPPGVLQPVPGLRYVTERNLTFGAGNHKLAVDDELTSTADPTIKVVVVTIEQDMTWVEGNLRRQR